MALPEAAHFGGANQPVKERPLVPPLIDDRSMLMTITSRFYTLDLLFPVLVQIL